MVILKRLLLVFLLLCSLQIKAQVINGDGSVYVENIVVTENQDCIISGSFAKNIHLLGNSVEGVNNMYFASIEKANKLGFMYPSLLSISSIAYSNDRLYIFGNYYRFTKLFGLRLSSDGRYKSFLAAYNIKDKRLEWYHNFEGNADVSSSQICVDNRENVYVCGSYKDNVLVEEKELTKLSDRNIYVAAFDKEGKNLWMEAIAAGGDSEFDSKEISLCTDGNSNLYLSFSAIGKIYCGEIGIQTTKLYPEEEDDICICENIFASFTTSGECLMLKSIITQANVKDMKYVNNQLVFGGYYTGSKDIGKNYAVSVFGDKDRLKANFNTSRNIVESPFVASFTTEGDLNWTYTIQSENIIKVEAIDVDEEGYTYVSAYYFDKIILDGNTYKSTGEGSYSDAIILKLNKSGSLQEYWVFEGLGHNIISDIVVKDDLIYLATSFYKEFSDGKNTYTSEKEHPSALIFQVPL